MTLSIRQRRKVLARLEREHTKAVDLWARYVVSGAPLHADATLERIAHIERGIALVESSDAEEVARVA